MAASTTDTVVYWKSRSPGWLKKKSLKSATWSRFFGGRVIKRYFLAFTVFVAVTVALEGVFDFFLPDHVAGAAAVTNFMALVTVKNVVVTFVGFGVGAYILRKNALLPGLILFTAMLLPATYILYQIALPARPGLTVVDVVSGNRVMFFFTGVACILGLVAGEWAAQRVVRGECEE